MTSADCNDVQHWRNLVRVANSLYQAPLTQLFIMSYGLREDGEEREEPSGRRRGGNEERRGARIKKRRELQCTHENGVSNRKQEESIVENERNYEAGQRWERRGRKRI